MQYSRKIALTLALAGFGAAMSGTMVHADITGFNGGTGYTLNSSGPGGVTVTGDSATLTDNNGGEARSIFYNTVQNIADFSTTFTYQYGGTGSYPPADGIAFVLQNDPNGAAALGGNGGGLGYLGITPSAAIELNLYPYSPGGMGTAFNTNGTTGQMSGASYQATGPVSLTSGNPITVALTYDGTTLTESLSDSVTSQIYNTSYAANLPSLLGGGTAYVGFTGGTGGLNATQTVSAFRFNGPAAVSSAGPAAVPEPSTVAPFAVSGFALLTLTLLARRKARTA